jgi:hypothetical protein
LIDLACQRNMLFTYDGTEGSGEFQVRELPHLAASLLPRLIVGLIARTIAGKVCSITRGLAELWAKS